MRNLYALAFFFAAYCSQAQVVINTTSSNTFSPDEPTIELGETVTFNIAATHTATQVNEATWLANGSTPLPGGFNFSAGTHEYTPTEIGTIYFVCQPHVFMGMKGMITVDNTTGINVTSSFEVFRIYPNPVANEFNVELPRSSSLVIMDIQGRELMNITVHLNDRISVAHLPEGNYTAILRNSEGRTTGTQRLTIAR